MAAVWFNVRRLSWLILSCRLQLSMWCCHLILWFTNLGFGCIIWVFTFVRRNWLRWCFFLLIMIFKKKFFYAVWYFWHQNLVTFTTAGSGHIQFFFSVSLVLSCYFIPPPPSANMSLEHNWTVLIKRVVCTKAKSPDNTMFSIHLKWMPLSVIAQLRLKLKIIMKDKKTEE